VLSVTLAQFLSSQTEEKLLKAEQITKNVKSHY